MKCLLFAFTSNKSSATIGNSDSGLHWFVLASLRNVCQEFAHVDDSGSLFRSTWRQLWKWFRVSQKDGFESFFFYMLECGSTSEVAVVIHIYLYFIECKFLMLNVKKKVSICWEGHDLRLNMYFVDFVPDTWIKLLWLNTYVFYGLWTHSRGFWRINTHNQLSNCEFYWCLEEHIHRILCEVDLCSGHKITG